MSTFAIVSLPSYSLATSSSTGANILHGPHHSAQKSTRTGLPDCRTSLSNVASDTCLMASFMGNLLLSWRHRGSGLVAGQALKLTLAPPKQQPPHGNRGVVMLKFKIRRRLFLRTALSAISL